MATGMSNFYWCCFEFEPKLLNSSKKLLAAPNACVVEMRCAEIAGSSED